LNDITADEGLREMTLDSGPWAALSIKIHCVL